MLLQRSEVAGRLVDVRTGGGQVRELADRLAPRPGEDVVDAAGGALLPGLHDHHLHLLAMAAADRSVDCGPPAVADVAALAAALRRAAGTAAPGSWLRGTGYAESVAGPLDRDLLDRIVADRPVRVQHRGGALWVVNSAGVDALRLAADPDPDVERDDAGRPTGRLWRYDARLRQAAGADPPPLAAVAARLAGYGLTGVTDASPELDRAALALLAGTATGLPWLQVLADVTGPLPPGITLGPRKLLLRDHDLPGLDDLAAAVAAAHAAGRAVAVHCVTREALLLTLAALDRAGGRPGDRIEHAAVVPPGTAGRLAAAGLRVVTQPSLLAGRGDDYAADVDPADLPGLYPYASLLAAGVPVAPSSDAPYGDPDPWRTIAAAADRRTPAGVVLGPAERVPTRVALAGFLTPLADPGGRPRRVEPGAPADLCLLSSPLAEALAEPDTGRVRLVLRGGAVVAAR